ncbi:MAG: AAA family ATPase, partial [Acidobacteria bacterium]|nr:AAA family ATPase [Acidobacteriota bacterium]
FKNTVIIMTSNIGSHFLLEGVTDQGTISEDARTAVLRELRAHFRPEFLNRVDDVVLFKPLTLGEIGQIVDLLTQDLSRRLADRNIHLELSDPARELVAREGFDPVYGARPLKRYLQHQVETRLGRAILAGEVADGSTVRIGVDGRELAVEVLHPEAATAPA